MARLRRGILLRGQYRVEEALGQGAMACVYRASDVSRTGAAWAVKVLEEDDLPSAERAEAAALFRREAEMLAGLHHPGLPQVVDVFSEPSGVGPATMRHVLVMQHIAGETLEDRMERLGRPLREEELLPLLVQLTSCLRYLHSRQPHPVVFRDLKPSNCMLTCDGKLLLIDFGIARYYKPGQPSDTQVLGTPGFSAPEQYGRAQTDPRSDIYSLGVFAWHLLSGADPVAAGFAFPPLRSVAPGASARLEAIVSRCLAFDPADRYPGTDRLLEDLQALTPARRPSPPSPATAASAVPASRDRLPRTMNTRFVLRWLVGTFRITAAPPSGLPRLVAVGVLLLFLLPFISIVARAVRAQEVPAALSHGSKCIHRPPSCARTEPERDFGMTPGAGWRLDR